MGRKTKIGSQLEVMGEVICLLFHFLVLMGLFRGAGGGEVSGGGTHYM
jgi:hypothetical protein